MIKTITSRNAAQSGSLLDVMFRARGHLFVDHLGWDVRVDGEGREIDRFDALSPVYIVDVDDRGRHRGSVRLLPTTGETVLHDRIAAMLDGVSMASPSVWEYTRFCVVGPGGAPLARREMERVTTDLMLAICETCIAAGADHVVGSFDRRMDAFYRRTGWVPELLGRSGSGADAVYLGLWDTTEKSAAILRAAGGTVGPAIVSLLLP